jgi:hypothetical protein
MSHNAITTSKKSKAPVKKREPTELVEDINEQPSQRNVDCIQNYRLRKINAGVDCGNPSCLTDQSAALTSPVSLRGKGGVHISVEVDIRVRNRSNRHRFCLPIRIQIRKGIQPNKKTENLCNFANLLHNNACELQEPLRHLRDQAKSKKRYRYSA